VASAIVQENHEIGNHSMMHRNPRRASDADVTAEVSGMQQLIKERLGVTPTLYRPPYGLVGARLKEVCQKENLKIICWTVDTEDWKKGATREKIVNRTMRDVTGGAIVLLHATHQASIDATATLIPELRAKGYQFGTVSELLQDQAAREQIRKTAPATLMTGAPSKGPGGQSVAGATAPAEPVRPIRLPRLPSL